MGDEKLVIPIKYNLNCGRGEALANEAVLYLYLLKKEVVDPDTEVVSFVPPDRARWERLTIVQSSYNTIMTPSMDLIPEERKKPGVSYRTNVFESGGVHLVSTGSVFISFNHFGHDALLKQMVYESLIETGIPAEFIGMVGNDILMNSKKVAGFYGCARGGYAYEGTVININYDDALFKSLLPDKDYERVTETGNGITGIENEIPHFDVVDFYNKVMAKRDRAPAWVDGLDSSKFYMLLSSSVDIQNLEKANNESNLELIQAKSMAREVKVNSFIKNCVQPLKDEIQNHRDRMELGRPLLLTNEEYTQKLADLVYAREYLSGLEGAISSAQTIGDVASIKHSIQEYNKYMLVEKAKAESVNIVEP